MNLYLMKKAMIETAITRGIKEMEEDPGRSVRRLADLGKQFSKNRFQEQVFSVMQELLDNEDSAYYDMVHNLLKNSDHEAMKKFGINFGYMGWAHGAARIRETQKEKGFCIPWCLMLQYDPHLEGGYTMDQLSHLIEQGQELGIYVYFIRECGENSDSYELLELLERYKDCAFVWFKEDGRLTAAQIQMLRVCTNTVVALPVNEPEAQLTAALLRDQKVIFAMYYGYQDHPSTDKVQMITELVLASESALFFLIAGSADTSFAAQLAYDSRLRQDYPFCIMDYYGDGRSISRVVAEHENLLEIGADGRIVRTDGSTGEVFDFDAPLLEVLAALMPAFEDRQDS